MEIVDRPLGEIRPYGNNPRRNAGAVDAVAASLREYGFRQPIVVDEDGVIVVGHTRYQAALKLGLETAPVHVMTGATPEQIRAYRIADNSTGEIADWDVELLAEELRGLAGDSSQLDETTRDALGLREDLARLLIDDQVPQVAYTKHHCSECGHRWGDQKR